MSGKEIAGWIIVLTTLMVIVFAVVLAVVTAGV